MLKEALNIKYWNSYYKNKNLALHSTKFAVFCKKKLKHYKGILYDIGCGNGRDSIYFNKKRIYCVGIDKSFQAIYKSKKKFSIYKNHFKRKNFCNFFSNQIINDKFSVYSRFSLHSITYEHEKQLFNSLIKQKNLEYLFIESRTLDDELYGKGKKVGKHEFVWENVTNKHKYIASHYRRFIDPSVLKKQLKKNFNVIYFKKSKGFARFRKEDPCVLRIIAKKKSV